MGVLFLREYWEMHIKAKKYAEQLRKNIIYFLIVKIKNGITSFLFIQNNKLSYYYF